MNRRINEIIKKMANEPPNPPLCKFMLNGTVPQSAKYMLVAHSRTVYTMQSLKCLLEKKNEIKLYHW